MDSYLEAMYRRDGSIIENYRGEHTKIKSFIILPNNAKGLVAENLFEEDYEYADSIWKKNDYIFEEFGSRYEEIKRFNKDPQGKDLLLVKNHFGKMTYMGRNGESLNEYGLDTGYDKIYGFKGNELCVMDERIHEEKPYKLINKKGEVIKSLKSIKSFNNR